MQYDKIQQVSEDTVLASHLASQKGVKMPQMPETVIYPFGLNQSQKLGSRKGISLQNQYHSGFSGYWKDTDNSEYHRQCRPKRKNRGGSF